MTSFESWCRLQLHRIQMFLRQLFVTPPVPPHIVRDDWPTPPVKGRNVKRAARKK